MAGLDNLKYHDDLESIAKHFQELGIVGQSVSMTDSFKTFEIYSKLKPTIIASKFNSSVQKDHDA